MSLIRLVIMTHVVRVFVPLERIIDMHTKKKEN